MATTTLAGCIALIGPDAKATEGPVDIVIDGRRISAIRPAGVAAPEGTVIDARRRLVTPGLINGHFHSHEHFHKGRYDNLPLELWMNYVRPPKPIPFTVRQVYLRTMIGAIEALRSGTTTVCDDVNVAPILHRDHVEAVFQAYEDAGIRAHVGITLFDKPFFRGMPFVDEEFPEDLLRALSGTPATPPEEILAFARELAATRHPRRNRVGYIAAPSAPQRCTEGFLRQVRAMADEFDLPVMMHVQETRLQVVTGHLLFGSTMVEYLDRLGFLTPKTALIHCIWLNPREIGILARAGVTVQHNPTCNLKVGSGIAPLRALLDAGVNVSLGTDGCGSVETTDMQKAVLTAALLQKIRGSDHRRWVGAEEAWAAGTIGGARALGRDDELGAVAVGRIADLAAYRLDSIPFTPLNNLLRQLVYAETGANLDMVFVDGEPVVMNGRLTRVDESALLSEIAAEHATLLPLIEEAERSVEPIRAAYQRIYDRCQAAGIAADTFPARLPD
ncbi:MAG TPA: amidohydrolase [Methylomirabilota bacterium]|jgi:guanine deaminase|nr:amidohydrolase [Methylomirabilota bacterium]